MLKFNVGSTETSGKITDVRDVLFYINLGHYENSVDKPNLHKCGRKGGIQQKNREEAQTHRLWNNQDRCDYEKSYLMIGSVIIFV